MLLPVLIDLPAAPRQCQEVLVFKEIKRVEPGRGSFSQDHECVQTFTSPRVLLLLCVKLNIGVMAVVLQFYVLSLIPN